MRLKALIDPNDATSATRELLLQQIACNVVIAEPMSGVTGQPVGLSIAAATRNDGLLQADLPSNFSEPWVAVEMVEGDRAFDVEGQLRIALFDREIEPREHFIG